MHETKYLGVMIDKNLKWGSQAKFLRTKISRALALLKYANDTPMYADDTAISYSSKKIEEIDDVANAELACLEKWLQGNKLSFDIVQTQAMIIGSAQKLGQMNKTSEITPCFQVSGNDIELVHQTKYLGVMIDENLKWGSQATFHRTEISRALGLLKYAKQFVQEETLRNMYLSIVEPHLNYCCSVWGCCGDV